MTMTIKEEENFCACGCGKIILSYNIFAHGHNGRGVGGFLLFQIIPNHHECACGCGELVASDKIFKKGHHRRNVRSTDKTKKQISDSLKITNGTPEARKANSERQKIAQGKPESRLKQSNLMISLWEDEEWREITILAQTKGKNTPEAKEAMSIASSARWVDPGYRETTCASLKVAQNNPDVRKRQLASVKITNVTPETQARRSNATKISHNKPEWRKGQSDLMYRLWKEDNYVSNQIKARNIKQNKTEKRLENITLDLFPNEYKFVGHGEFILAGKCPDFVNINGQKKIIELYGDWWHRNNNPQDRIDLFAKYGYDTLVVWEHELNDIEALKIRLIEFHNRVNPYSEHKCI